MVKAIKERKVNNFMSSPVHRIDVLNLSEVEIAKFRSHLIELSTDQCWEYRTKEPRGRIFFYRERGKLRIQAHRLAYYLHYGVDPGNLLVCHKCDNPVCCNPHHLFLGTINDNNQDKVSKGRQSKKKFGDSHWTRTNPEKVRRGDAHYSRHSPHLMSRGDRHPARLRPEIIHRGEDHYATKVSDADALRIRKLATLGWSYPKLAKKFNVSTATISRIVNRQTRKNL